ARLIRNNRRIRNQKRVDLADEKSQAAESAGQQEQVLVLKNSPSANRTGTGVDPVIDEVHDSRVAMAPIRFVGEPHHDRLFEFPRGWLLTRGGKPGIADVVGLRGIEGQMDGI